jgi:pimeloyl-ACP methyl ester carboxylesterase
VYGHSSGAGLVLHAAARGLPFTKVVLHEPPFGSEDEEVDRQHAENVMSLLAQGRRADAVELHLTGAGFPPEALAEIRQGSWWTWMEANAHTLPYDFEAMSARSRGGATPAQQAASVTVPTLALAGGASPDWIIDAARRLADAAPNGRHTVLEGQEHVVPPEVLAPVLAEFLTG